MTDVTDRLKAYNDGTYDAATNPRGFAGIGGMDANWAQALNDVGAVAGQVADTQGHATAAADGAAAAATSATAAASSATTAVAAAATAQAAVDSVAGGPVASINGHTGVVTLTASDVGAVDTAATGTAAFLEPSQIAGLYEVTHGGSVALTAQPLRRCERATASVTFSLPLAGDCPSGWHRHVSARGGAVTIVRQGGDTLNGGSSLTLAQGETALIVRTSPTAFERY